MPQFGPNARDLRDRIAPFEVRAGAAAPPPGPYS